jgi:hypothetical protein
MNSLLIWLAGATVLCPGLQEEQRVNALENDGGKREPILILWEHARNHDCCVDGRVYFFPDSVRLDLCLRHNIDTEDFRCGWCHRATDEGWTPATEGWVWIEAAMKLGWHIRHLFQSSANTWECVLTYRNNTQMPSVCVIGTAETAFTVALKRVVGQGGGTGGTVFEEGQ